MVLKMKMLVRALLLVLWMGCSSPEPMAVFAPALSVVSLSLTSLRLEWKSVSDDHGVVKSYQIMRRVVDGDSVVVTKVEGTFFIDNGLDPIEAYFYSIQPLSSSNPTVASQSVKVRFAASFEKMYEVAGYGTAAYNPALQLVASIQSNDDTKFYNAKTGTSVRSSTVRGEYGAFSPDGSLLGITSYTYGESTAKVQAIRVSDGSLLYSRKAHTKDARPTWAPLIKFRNDGLSFVTAEYNPSLLYWDASTGQTTFSVNDSGPRISTLAVSPDGQWTATANDWRIKLRRFADATLARVLEYHASDVSALAFSNDSKYLASGDASYGTLCIWNMSDGSLLQTIQNTATGSYVGISAIAFTNSATDIFTGSSDGLIKLWNWKTGALQMAWRGYYNSITLIAQSEDSTQLITAGSSSVTGWSRSSAGIWYIVQ